MSPDDISLRLIVVWQTTSTLAACRDNIGLGVSAPKELKIAAIPSSRKTASLIWNVYRDAFLPGQCGWMMKSIEVLADTAGYPLKIDRTSNIPNRVAYVLSSSEYRPSNTWAENSDVDKPVYLFCDFKQLHALDRQTTSGLVISENPCAKGWEKYHGTALGKKENILLPEQHNVSFVVEHYQ